MHYCNDCCICIIRFRWIKCVFCQPLCVFTYVFIYIYKYLVQFIIFSSRPSPPVVCDFGQKILHPTITYKEPASIFEYNRVFTSLTRPTSISREYAVYFFFEIKLNGCGVDMYIYVRGRSGGEALTKRRRPTKWSS